MRRPKVLFYGIATALPGFAWLERRAQQRGTGAEPVSPRYSYSVWLRHVAKTHLNGLWRQPQTVAELGPGDSLGATYAALISGVDRAYGLDSVRFAEPQHDLVLFDVLVEMFRNREPIPDATEFPKIRPLLADYSFPSSSFPDEHLVRALEPTRIARIRASLAADDGTYLTYVAPWSEDQAIAPCSVDMLFSQAVLEHVEDVAGLHTACRRWLRDGGFVSHTIDYKCHDISSEWNAHWMYEEWLWRLIQGRRIISLNRLMHSDHLRALKAAGLQIVAEEIETSATYVKPSELARRFRGAPRTDITSSGATIQALKTPGGLSHG